jgi:hypothetical protein
MVGGETRTRRGRGRRSTRRTEEEAQQDDAVQQQMEQQALSMRRSRTTTMRRSRTTTTPPLSRTSLVLAPQVRGTSTCEVPRVFLSDPYFVIDVR